MLLGALERGPSVKVLAPEPIAEATLREGMEIRLQAEGLAPVFSEVKSTGVWESRGDDDLKWTLRSLVQRPESGQLGSALQDRLATMDLPQGLPLGPFSLFSESAGVHGFDLTQIPFDEASGLQVAGHWQCTRNDGVLSDGLRAQELSCTLAEGRFIQEGKGPHAGTVMEARLVGVLHGIRGASDSSNPKVEEVRLELAAQRDAPTRLSFKTSYYRIWCASAEGCPADGP